MTKGPDSGAVRLSDQEAARLVHMYEQAEAEITREIARGLAKGNNLDHLRAMLANVQAIIRDLQQGNRTWCEEAIPRNYVRGLRLAEKQLAASGVAVKGRGGFSGIHEQAAQVLAENAFNRLEDVAQVIGRRTEDLFRELALEAVRGPVVGYATWEQAARRIRNDLAANGVTGFVDSRGRRWNMSRYAEMVARTTTMEAHLQGTCNRLLEAGIDLVRITSHGTDCDLCGPWEGKVVSLTGKTPGYPTLQEARDAGLFHPNCRHDYGAVPVEPAKGGTT